MEKSKSIKTCVYLDCNTRCLYNFQGLRASYCASHKQIGMIDVNNKQCSFEGCNTKPSFNFENEKTPIYCASHKQYHFFYVKNKPCMFEGCNTKPIFNFENEKTPIYCVIHKKLGMIDIKNKRCVFEGCNITPSFNFENEKTATYCASHKKNGMTNVIHKMCAFDNCNTRPNYNNDGEKIALYCVHHKKENMILIGAKKCSFENCIKIPSYNFEGKTQKLYCFEHKHPGMLNVGSKKCKSEWCYVQVTHKYDGYCLYCFIHLFPEKTVSRNYKTKERNVVEYVLREFPQYSWTNDKQIQDGCSRRRPDLFMDFGYQILIIEIDENQHTGETYGDSSCENKRMMLLSQDVGHRPIVFIRFNPDDYYEKDQHITSCFGLNSFGVCCVKKTKQPEWTQRLNVLKKNIQYWCDHRLEKTLEIIPLFYSSSHTLGQSSDQSSGTKESSSS